MSAILGIIIGLTLEPIYSIVAEIQDKMLDKKLEKEYNRIKETY